MAIGEAVRQRLADELERARDRGALGPSPVEGQLEHSLGFAECVATPPTEMLDLGSGGGIPGLVLAALWDQTRITLLDASSRRCEGLRLAVHRLGWGDRIVVEEGRAEEIGRDPAFREHFDLVTARSFGPPAVTAECSTAFLVPDGVLVVSEPPRGSDSAGSEEQRWSPEGLAKLGLSAQETVRDSAAGFQVISRVGSLPSEYPRRVGIPARRPLWG